jgi:hypothetical protein
MSRVARFLYQDPCEAGFGILRTDRLPIPRRPTTGPVTPTASVGRPPDAVVTSFQRSAYEPQFFSGRRANASSSEVADVFFARFATLGLIPGARWQSGHAAACKAAYAGSIPTLASIHFSSAKMAPGDKSLTQIDQPPAANLTILGFQSLGESDDGRATFAGRTRATPQRPGRQARRAHRPRVCFDSLHHPQDSVLRGADRGRPGAARAQRRPHPRGGRHRLSRRSGGDRDLEGSRGGCARRARAFRARHVPHARATHRAARVHPACPQSCAQRGHRRQEHRVRTGVRLALRAQSGRRPALCAHRGFPQFRQARLHVQFPAPLGAAPSANRSICRSTSGTSTWFTAI